MSAVNDRENRINQTRSAPLPLSHSTAEPIDSAVEGGCACDVTIIASGTYLA